MRKIERRAAVCLLLSAALVLGTCIFCLLCADRSGKSWESGEDGGEIFVENGTITEYPISDLEVCRKANDKIQH